jgi:hypothetical protein
MSRRRGGGGGRGRGARGGEGAPEGPPRAGAWSRRAWLRRRRGGGGVRGTDTAAAWRGGAVGFGCGRRDASCRELCATGMG